MAGRAFAHTVLQPLLEALSLQLLVGVMQTALNGMNRVARDPPRARLIGLSLTAVLVIHAALAVRSVLATPVDLAVLQWCLYMICVTMYHWSEFWMVAKFHPDELTSKSFLVDHSPAFTVMILLAWAEFWLEWYFSAYGSAFPVKAQWWAICLGAVMMYGGQTFRSLAMFTAGKSFTHQISVGARDSPLVTHGVYTYLRHPSYFGWFWWCVGSQVLLSNPVCVFAYIYMGWRFFEDRIPYEEEQLSRQFPRAYAAYAARTVSCVQSARRATRRPHAAALPRCCRAPLCPCACAVAAVRLLARSLAYAPAGSRRALTAL